MAPNLDTTYAEQIETDARNLKQATGMTHQQYIDSLRLSIRTQVADAAFLLAAYQLPIPESNLNP